MLAPLDFLAWLEEENDNAMTCELRFLTILDVIFVSRSLLSVYSVQRWHKRQAATPSNADCHA